ncbi:lysine exporter LysO family protein [Patescibacteria group bacterium]|nr:lysine exporter LysO family protein [Patescibacteria group bacterium]
MTDMLIVSIFLIAGLVTGFSFRSLNALGAFVSRLGTVSLCGLLVLLGISVGADTGIFNDLKSLGLRALLISAASILGSIMVTNIFAGVLKKGPANR